MVAQTDLNVVRTVLYSAANIDNGHKAPYKWLMPGVNIAAIVHGSSQQVAKCDFRESVHEARAGMMNAVRMNLRLNTCISPVCIRIGYICTTYLR